MAYMYWVRTGALGEIGRFTSVANRYARHTRVIVRGATGLQLGVVLAPSEPGATESAAGMILRPAAPEDELLAARLSQRRAEAIERCQRELARIGHSTVILDAEYSLDASALRFYFLGEPPDAADHRLRELADVFGATVQLEAFAKTLAEGCGPDCGTEAGGGCGSGGCTVCALNSACQSAPPANGTDRTA